MVSSKINILEIYYIVAYWIIGLFIGIMSLFLYIAGREPKYLFILFLSLYVIPPTHVIINNWIDRIIGVFFRRIKGE